MPRPLLTTKLQIPPPRPDLVVRPRLLDRLDEGVRQSHRLALIAAPAGFGKTTLISHWLHESDRPAAWLSLDETDGDPAQFLEYLVAALQGIDESVGSATLDLLATPQIPPAPALITPLVNDLATLPPFTLVLDDFHVVRSPDIYEILAFLVAHSPPSMHLTIGTREDPPLPLAQLRARGQITEMRQHDLRFTTEEATEFLTHSMDLDLDAQAIAALENRTEGWVAGLQLAALALQRDDSITDDFIAAFTGSDRYVMDYLMAEVLAHQPPDMHDFLRETSVLDQLTAPLCDALTGRDDSADLLQQLDAANLFVIPLDNRRQWYRYHRLFSGMMRLTLKLDEQYELHTRAANWYDTNGYTDQAVNHVLACADLSGELDAAEDMIRRAAEDSLHSGNLNTVTGWLDALPESRIRSDAHLSLIRAWTLALSGDMARAEAYVRAADGLLDGSDVSTELRGRLYAIRAFIALSAEDDTRLAEEAAANALDLLGDDQPHWRVTAQWVLAESRERSGPITVAIDAFRDARQAGFTLDNPIFQTTIEISLALALNTYGERLQAVAVCEDALQRLTADGSRVPPMAGLLYSRLGQLAYEANDLEQANDYHQRGLDLTAALGIDAYQHVFRGLAAPTLAASSSVDDALDALNNAAAYAGAAGTMDPGFFHAQAAHIHLRRGDVPAARRWAESAGYTPDIEPDYLTIEQHLTYARLLLAEGRNDDAAILLDTLDTFTADRELIRWRITLYLLRALHDERTISSEAALDPLREAVALAAPGGYVRAFVDEDTRIIALLDGVRGTAPSFVDDVMSAAGLPSVERVTTSQPLIEPLSERELEVLELISTGLTNRDIADRLVIAVGTVKTHINNIYGKLGVRSRTEAIARARSLRILN